MTIPMFIGERERVLSSAINVASTTSMPLGEAVCPDPAQVHVGGWGWLMRLSPRLADAALHKKKRRSCDIFRTILVGAPFQSRQCAVGAAPPFSWGLGTEIQKRAGQKRSWQIGGAEQGTGRAGFAFSRTREIPKHWHSRNR